VCARVEISEPGLIRQWCEDRGLSLLIDDFPRYNIGPHSVLPVLWQVVDPKAELVLWGMTPKFWKGDGKPKLLHNARSETIWERANFKYLIRGYRCVVLVNGFFEWVRSGTSKLPYHIQMSEAGQPLCLAGIWHMNDDHMACSIVTTGSNSLMAPIHDRMPVVLDDVSIATWLTTRKREEVDYLMKPCPSEWLMATPVDPCINNMRYQGPFHPVDTQSPQL